MTTIELLSAFLIGMAGSVHCIGMCGGIASAFSFAIPKHTNKLTYHLAYNIGRISSYVIAGAIVGYIGSIAETRLDTTLPILSILSALFLLLMGLYIGQWWMGLSKLERWGSKLWRYISPLGKKLIPFKNPGYAFFYGSIWGWLPCGLVYSALVWSMSSGGAVQGSIVMLLFGLGTMPALLAAGISAELVKSILKNPALRNIIAFTLILSSTYLLFEMIKSNN